MSVFPRLGRCSSWRQEGSVRRLASSVARRPVAPQARSSGNGIMQGVPLEDLVGQTQPSESPWRVASVPERLTSVRPQQRHHPSGQIHGSRGLSRQDSRPPQLRPCLRRTVARAERRESRRRIGGAKWAQAHPAALDWNRMVGRYELRCSHCGHRYEYPVRCAIALAREGTEVPLAQPETDALAQLGESWAALRARRLVRTGYPTVCLTCGQLDAHRADRRRYWRCTACGGCDIHQLGVDTHSTGVLVGLGIAVLLVAIPATSNLWWSLPGLGTVVLFAIAWWYLNRLAQSRLRQAPCTACEHPGLVQARVLASGGSAGTKPAPALDHYRS